MENQSATIGTLAGALAKAQGEMKAAVKDSANPFFKSSYADLAAVWDACREPLSKNGLAVIQTTETMDDLVIVFTTLAHSSGEWVRGALALRPTKSDPQGFGSAITYGRRYGLMGIAGIAPEEDDGNAAPAHPPTPVQSSQKRLPLSPTKALEAEAAKVRAEKAKATLDQAQIKHIYALADEFKVPAEAAKEFLSSIGYAKLADVKREDFDRVCKWFSSTPPPVDPVTGDLPFPDVDIDDTTDNGNDLP